MYFYNCPEWMTDGLEDATCETTGAAGAAGASSTVPALARVCAGRNLDDDARYLIACLAPLRTNPCAADHEQAVLECLSSTPPCGVDYDANGCTEMMAACPEITPAECYWGTLPWREVPLQECFTAGSAEADEPCEARFLRCAWGF